MPRLSVADLADLGRALRPRDLGGALLVVDLATRDPAVMGAAALTAAALPVPVIGLLDGPADPGDRALLSALTVTLAPGTGPYREVVYADDLRAAGVTDGTSGGLAALAAAVTAAPRAAVGVNGVLRMTAQLPVWDGLVAESAVYSLLLAGPEFARWRAGAKVPRPAPDGDEPVLVSRDDATGSGAPVLRVQLHRPERRNAFGRGVRDALIDALGIAAADPELAVHLSGAGPDFCSGGDLAEFGTAPDPATAHEIRLTRSAGWMLHGLAARTTARVHGACVGAGIELPAFVSQVSAAPDARFLLPELSMGLVPGAGGTVSITRRIGRWRTAWWALTGQWLTAPLALHWGLVDRVEP